jgi:hypothetical protein
MDSAATRPWHCLRTDCPASTHDTYPAYRQGCRSGSARIERSRYLEDWKAGTTRRVALIGISRRIEACHAVGWSGHDIAAVADCGRQRVSELRRGGQTFMLASTAAAMAPALERLAMTWPPNTRTHRKICTWARNRGFAPLLAWEGLDIDDPNEVPPSVVEDDLTHRRVSPMSRAATSVEVDEHLLEHVLDPLSPTKFTKLSVAEQDHIVERLWRDAVAEGYEFPGRRVAERLEVDYRKVESVRGRIQARRTRERQAS